MAKEEFVPGPFRRMKLATGDVKELQVVANAILEANLERYQQFTNAEFGKVDTNSWKYIKTKDQIKVYAERRQKRRRFQSSPTADSDSELQSMLCVGSTPGTLDDVMLGILGPTLESVRTKSAFVDDRSGSSVLSVAKAPTTEEPFDSVVVNWMELEVRRRSMGLVKNRDYIYLESTGIHLLPNGGRLGYRLMHSVDFPQAHVLEGRVRAKLSVCCFFRQETESSVSVYMMGMMDPMSDGVRRVIVPRFVKKMLAPLKYAHYGEMKKLTQALGERYAELKTIKTRDPDHNCTACMKHLGRLGKLVGHHSTCKLCFRYVCNSCRVEKEMSFVTLDLKMTQRKVTFCPACVSEATTMSLPELPDVENRTPATRYNRNNSVGSSVSSGWGTLVENSPRSIAYDFTKNL
uniref:FYVE-type domain-containing protein n=1 Tax=Phytophthora ramorum TaxID=164328 RepID=H3GZQ6_PHYRM